MYDAWTPKVVPAILIHKVTRGGSSSLLGFGPALVLPSCPQAYVFPRVVQIELGDGSSKAVRLVSGCTPRCILLMHALQTVPGKHELQCPPQDPKRRDSSTGERGKEGGGGGASWLAVSHTGSSVGQYSSHQKQRQPQGSCCICSAIKDGLKTMLMRLESQEPG